MNTLSPIVRVGRITKYNRYAVRLQDCIQTLANKRNYLIKWIWVTKLQNYMNFCCMSRIKGRTSPHVLKNYFILLMQYIQYSLQQIVAL